MTHVCFKTHAFPRAGEQCPLAQLCSKQSSDPERFGAGGGGEEWKEVFVRKESSSPVVWEGRGQGSGHTERARLGAKRLVADDLTHKK